ncbi:MAG: hypothetical protein AB8B89_07175 [Gammaproteobacteria bacterium]
MIRIITILIIFSLYITASHADDLEISRIELEAKKKVHISKSLDLTPEQSAPFWDIYTDYEKASGKITKEAFDLIRKFSDGYKNNSISEQSATNMLATYFRLEGQRLQLKQQYYTLFQKVIPAKKVFRFFQIDNKVDSLIRCDIAKKLPLIEPDMEL